MSAAGVSQGPKGASPRDCWEADTWHIVMHDWYKEADT